MIRTLAAALIGTLVLALRAPATLALAEAPQATPVPPAAEGSFSPDVETQEAGDYCLLQGGRLIERWPFAGRTDAPPLRMSGSRWFCEFSGSPEANPPSSRISIEVSTLYADGPTLAALAYLAGPPALETDEPENRAAAYCSSLGGSSTLGTGGGWASDPSDPAGTVITVCMFPDGSAIDDWGLTYNAAGTIRGTDLTPLLRYQPSALPDVFDDQDSR